MPDQPRPAEPVRKTVTVPASPQRAFELFTAGIGEWWPLATHSVGQDQATGVVFGSGVGGTIVESLADGTTSVWGTVTRWEPPHLVACTWHAGTPVAEASSVEVTFTPGGPGETIVQLVHSGWERRPDAAAARSGYDAGWEPVLASYARLAASSALPG
jgi:uncharacterized protein YndB with AHSA1/START domain